MTKDEEHLKLLSIFHYVVAGFAALFALFPVFHLAVGLAFILAPQQLGNNGNLPPPFFGWVFVIFAGTFILLGFVFAAFVLAAGRCLARRRRYMFCLVMAGVETLFMPFGTVLGVFTIIVLLREGVKSLFAAKTALQTNSRSDSPLAGS